MALCHSLGRASSADGSDVNLEPLLNLEERGLVDRALAAEAQPLDPVLQGTHNASPTHTIILLRGASSQLFAVLTCLVVLYC